MNKLTNSGKFKYQICSLPRSTRKKKLSSSRVKKNRKSGGGVCPSTKYPRCMPKHSGYAKCAKRPSKKSKK